MTFLISLMLIILFFLSRRYIKRFEPAGVFAGVWILFTIGILLMQNYITLRYEGIIFIVGCTILFTMGTTFGDAVLHPKKSQVSLTFNRQRALPVMIILFAGAMVNPLYSIFLHGFNLQALLSMQDLLDMNSRISEDRYTSGNVTNVVNQFFLIFCYAAPLFGGFCFRWVGKFTKAICVFTLIPGMFVALTQSMKMAMITGFVLWFTGFFVCAYSYGIPIKIKPKYLMYSVAGILAFLGILFISMVFRTGELSEKSFVLISRKFIAYALGHFHCFDIWYTSHGPLSYSFGTKTFLGISNIIGLEDRIQGIYQEYYQIGKNGYYGIANVFTCFRPLIEDFGEAGGCLAMFVAGVFTKFSLKCLEAMRYIFLNQTILTATYAYLLWSFGASFFAYTSYVAMFIIAIFIFYFLQTKTYDVKTYQE